MVRQTRKILAVAQGDRVIVMYEAEGELTLTRTRQLDAATGQRVIRALRHARAGVGPHGRRDRVLCSDTTGLAWPGPVEEELMEIIEKLVAAIDAWAAREGLTGQVVIEVRENVVLVDVVKPE